MAQGSGWSGYFPQTRSGYLLLTDPAEIRPTMPRRHTLPARFRLTFGQLPVRLHYTLDVPSYELDNPRYPYSIDNRPATHDIDTIHHDMLLFPKCSASRGVCYF